MKRTIVAFAAVLALAANAHSSHQVVRLDDVILLAQEGLSDETILSFLDAREIGFALGPEEMVTLRDAGVSEEVIRYLVNRIAGGRPAPRRAYVAPPPLAYGSFGYSPYGYGAAYIGVSTFPHWWYDHHHAHVGHHVLGQHHFSPHGGHLAVHGFGHDGHAVPLAGHSGGHDAPGGFGAHGLGHSGGHEGAGHLTVGHGLDHGVSHGGHRDGHAGHGGHH